jgi:RimJ/RimL family protein N-acetyltransferase
VSKQIERTFIIDYSRDMTIVAVEGEPGYERVLAVGEYYMNPENNLAEIAFSVQKEWQGRGLSSTVIRKLAEAAKENGIAGFSAYTSKDNERMIKLFHSLDYEVKIKGEGDMVYLEALFPATE